MGGRKQVELTCMGTFIFRAKSPLNSKRIAFLPVKFLKEREERKRKNGKKKGTEGEGRRREEGKKEGSNKR